MKILISACLLGVNCRYDGNQMKLEEELVQTIKELSSCHTLIPVCPEIYGGLQTPRESAEIIGDKVISRVGVDVTKNYQRGAEEILKLAQFYHCTVAILKERSPSCGYGQVYDGTFSSTLIEGNGITAELLSKHGITVIGESKLLERGIESL